MKNWSSRIGGADPLVRGRRPVGLLAPRKMLMSLCRLRDEASRADQGVRPAEPPRVWFFDPVSCHHE